jgi:hypothetical protein
MPPKKKDAVVETLRPMIGRLLSGVPVDDSAQDHEIVVLSVSVVPTLEFFQRRELRFLVDLWWSGRVFRLGGAHPVSFLADLPREGRGRNN